MAAVLNARDVVPSLLSVGAYDHIYVMIDSGRQSGALPGNEFTTYCLFLSKGVWKWMSRRNVLTLLLLGQLNQLGWSTWLCLSCLGDETMMGSVLDDCCNLKEIEESSPSLSPPKLYVDPQYQWLILPVSAPPLPHPSRGWRTTAINHLRSFWRSWFWLDLMIISTFILRAAELKVRPVNLFE